MTDSASTPAPLPHGSGTCSFRMFPTDSPVSAGSTMSATSVAGDRATCLHYTWEHPDDGAQSGELLLGRPGEDGVVTAGWVDSWHQGSVTLLTGAATDRGARVSYEYAPGWTWELDIAFGAETELVMRNVIPEGVEGADPGPYDVMVARWAASEQPGS